MTSARIRTKKFLGAVLLAAAVSMLAVDPATAGYLDGMSAYQRGDYETAMDEWSLSARRGDFRAQFGVGILFLYGLGTDQDASEAAGYFRESSARGYPEARYALGVMHQDGNGVAQNYTEAARLYELAAWQGLAKAQNNLGILYVLGQGVEPDPVMAHVWFHLAARAGEPAAVGNRKRITAELSPEQRAAAERIASGWKASPAPEPPKEPIPQPITQPEPAPPVAPEVPVAGPEAKPAAEVPADAAEPPTPIIPAP